MKAPFLVVLLAGCAGEADTDPVLLPENVGPTLTHDAFDQVVVGRDLPVAVSAIDPDGVGQVLVYYRTHGESVWDTVFLERSEDLWTGVVPGDAIAVEGLEYYVRAQDASDLRVPSFLPEQGDDEPFLVPAVLDGENLPFEEDFEVTGAGGLYRLGWNEWSEAFPGARWDIGTSRVHTGESAASHSRGADGTGEIRDWLISPALDFSTLDNVELSWFESADYADLGNHELWISADSADPATGTWELLSALPVAPEDEWVRSSVFDLSAWAGDTSVWVAWVYQGEQADLWHIDDVVVQQRQADFSLSEASLTPDPALPGDSVGLTFEVANSSATESQPLQVRLQVDPAFGTAAAALETDPVAGNGDATWVLGLHIREDVPVNSYIPLVVEATDGETTWAWPRSIVVGQPSTSHLTVTRSGTGVLRLTLGVGDPAAPTLEIPVVSGVVSDVASTYDIDITDAHEMLPPEPGDHRWWLRVESDVAGSLDSFSMEWGGETFVSADLGAFGTDTTYFYLPKRPNPTLLSATTSPNPVQPGNTVTWNATLWNSGASTTGSAWVTLVSDDPDVVVLTDDPILLGAPWTPSSVQVPFQFQVSPSHRDSTPVSLRLELHDDVDDWSLSGSVAVPWPVLNVSRLGIDDFGDGDDDGILDPGETVEIEVTLANQGLRDTFGGVACVLSQTGGAGGSTILDATGNFGAIADGATAVEDDFEISVTGDFGDDLDFRLTCGDGTETYWVDFELVLGEAIWLDIDAIGDDAGDAVNSYPFDIVGGRYRSDGVTLEIELESAEPYDAGTLFVESWMLSDGGEYDFYQLVAQSGVGTLRGYDGSFHDLGEPLVTNVDDTHVVIELNLAEMDLALPSLSAGFATGFCGGADYYCDQYPDDWGNPYQTGLVTWRFADMNW